MAHFPGFTTLQLCNKVQEFISKMSEKPEEYQGRTTFMGDLKTMNRNANLTPTSFLSMQEYFHQEDGHSSDLDQKKSGILLMIGDYKENGTESLN